MVSLLSMPFNAQCLVFSSTFVQWVSLPVGGS